jgi:peroxiredoxin Q/BCP
LAAVRFRSVTLDLISTSVLLGEQADDQNDFKVKSATDDSTFALSEHKGKTVVLHFLLKTECPYCMRYTHEYTQLAEKNSDVVHVFLKPDSEDDNKAWTERLDKKGLSELPRIYRDEDAALADKFKIPDGYRFHGQKVHYPALVILDGEGKEQFRYVGKSDSDRLSVRDFEAKLIALKKGNPR